MSREVPPEWAKLMEAAGFTKQRRPHGPSVQKLAEAADVHPSTLAALVFGSRDSEPDTVEKVVRALAEKTRGKSYQRLRMDVYALAGMRLAAAQPFEAHPDAVLLTVQERNAVNELIRLLALPKKQGGGADDGNASPMTPPGSPSGDGIYSDRAAYDPEADQPTTD